MAPDNAAAHDAPDDVAPRDTILIRVTGPDGPGITSDLLSLLSNAGADVQDMEQVVVRRQLTLGLAITVPAGRDLVKEVLLFGYERGLEMNFEVVDATPTKHAERLVVTALAPELKPADLSVVTGGDRRQRREHRPHPPSLPPFRCGSYEFLVEGAESDKLPHRPHRSGR